MNETIMNSIKKLNSKDSLPRKSLRRNSFYYELVSYVNNSIALFISESYDEAVLFIKRAYKEMYHLKDIRDDGLSEVGSELDLYIFQCDEYFRLIVDFMIKNELISEYAFELIPNEYK